MHGAVLPRGTFEFCCFSSHIIVSYNSKFYCTFSDTMYVIIIFITTLNIIPVTYGNITNLIFPAPTPTEGPRTPCNPSPCGANAVCKERNGAGSCVCLPEYFGDPYTGCRPECVINSDCDRSKACLNNKCVDPCPGTCGLNAECRVVNHAPSCTCIVGYTGDPLSACVLIQPSKIILLLSLHPDII